MAVPIYYTPMKDISSNELYVDGCLIAHFPFHHLTDSERSETLGIAFKRDIKSSEPLHLGSYLLKLYHSVYYHHNDELYSKWMHRIIQINCGNFESFNFGADSDQKNALIETGRKSAQDFILNYKWLSGRSPVRRYSLP